MRTRVYAIRVNGRRERIQLSQRILQVVSAQLVGVAQVDEVLRVELVEPTLEQQDCLLRRLWVREVAGGLLRLGLERREDTRDRVGARADLPDERSVVGLGRRGHPASGEHQADQRGRQRRRAPPCRHRHWFTRPMTPTCPRRYRVRVCASQRLSSGLQRYGI